jgi:predicted dehydrogenase
MLATCEDAEIAAICGRTRTRADEMATRFQIAQVFTDYNAMIKSGGLDGVIVASPDDLHYPMVMAALQARLHVLCEKPLGLTVAQAQAMYEAAEEAGVKHLIEFTVRWMPHSRYLHQLVQEGYIGRATHYYFHHYGDRALDDGYEWRWDAARSLGQLGDTGSHTIALALWLGGEIRSVSAHLASFSQRLAPDDQPLVGANESAQLIINFADGAHGVAQAAVVGGAHPHASDEARWRRAARRGRGAGAAQAAHADLAAARAHSGPEPVQRGQRHAAPRGGYVPRGPGPGEEV